MAHETETRLDAAPPSVAPRITLDLWDVLAGAGVLLVVAAGFWAFPPLGLALVGGALVGAAVRGEVVSTRTRANKTHPEQ
jgi:hypothetical protein